MFGWQFWIGYVLIVLLQAGVAVLGHNPIHVFERTVFAFLAVAFALASAMVLAKTHYGAGFDPDVAPAGGQSAAFVLAIVIAYGYAAGWNPRR